MSAVLGAPELPASTVEAGPFCAWPSCGAPLSGPCRPGCGSPYLHALHKCAGKHCPGLPYRASDIGHPVSCAWREGDNEEGEQAPAAPVEALPPPSPLEAAALAFCAAIRPGGGLPSVADLCEAAATFRAERGGAS